MSEEDYDNNEPPKGVINFDQFMCKVLEGSDSKIFKLQLIGQERIFELKAASTEDCVSWCKAISKTILDSHKRNKQRPI